MGKKIDKLTYKQQLVLEDIVSKAKKGVALRPSDSVGKFYDVKNEKNAVTIATRNLKKEDFRGALVERLQEEGVIGANSRVSGVLIDGLSATDKWGFADYDARLRYAQEINKITGVYAPAKSERKSVNLNFDIGEEELDERIRQLQEELSI